MAQDENLKTDNRTKICPNRSS